VKGNKGEAGSVGGGRWDLEKRRRKRHARLTEIVKRRRTEKSPKRRAVPQGQGSNERRDLNTKESRRSNVSVARGRATENRRERSSREKEEGCLCKLIEG